MASPVIAMVAAGAVFALAAHANAGDTQAAAPKDQVTELVEPLLITIDKPSYPHDLLRRGIEGWVRLQFDVSADGTVSDIKMLSGFNQQLFGDLASKAVAAARFKPATENGAPVPWNDVRIDIPFIIEGTPMLKPGDWFAMSYKKVDALLAKQDFDDARQVIDAMLSRRVKTLTEYGMTEERLFRVETAENRSGPALQAIVQAAGALQFPHAGYVSAEYAAVLQEEFVFDVTVHRYAQASNVMKLLDSTPGFNPDATINRYNAALQAAVDSKDPITVPAKIEDGKWEYTPTRGTITVSELKGTLDVLEVECGRHAATISYEPNKEWTFPASWGACSITFDGSEGSTFTVVEYSEMNPGK